MLSNGIRVFVPNVPNVPNVPKVNLTDWPRDNRLASSYVKSKKMADDRESVSFKGRFNAKETAMEVYNTRKL